MTAQTRSLAATIAIGIALLAALWFMAIAPKRSEKASVTSNVTAQQTRLDAAKAQVASFTASREQFGGLMTELRGLDKAVPARGDISAMLRELQRRAKARGSELRVVALKDGAAPSTGGAATATTPGSVAGPGGLSALPFTFEYTGRYFDLVGILKTVRRSVRVNSGDLNIDGRLLTIDGMSFQRIDPGAQLTKAILNATAYIAADGTTAAPPAPAAGIPAAPAPATAATKGGS
jgi:Tfp pilus assembly protein PilO